MQRLAQQLELSLERHLADLSTRIHDLLGRLPRERIGLRAALTLAGYYPDAALEVHEHEKRLSGDDAEAQVLHAQLRLQDCARVGALIEQWFSLGDDIIPPFAQERSIQQEAHSLLGNREVVLSIGPPDNFTTFVRDLELHIFDNLGPRAPARPSTVSGKKYAMIQMPSIYGARGLWRPLFAHELAHLKCQDTAWDHGLAVWDRLDTNRAESLELPRSDAFRNVPSRLVLQAVALSWSTELVCDAYALRRFGPGAVSALGEFLTSVGGASHISATHPPASLRLRLLLEWLGDIEPGPLARLLAPWQELAGIVLGSAPPWVTHLVDVMQQSSADLYEVVEPWAGEYDWRSRIGEISRLAASLRRGIPECQPAGEGATEPGDEDLIVAGWLGWMEASDAPISRLVDKALESLEFVRLWRINDGDSTSIAAQQPRVRGDGYTPRGVLSREAVLSRLLSSGDSGLVITPVFRSSVSGAAVDLRLGPRFIVFEKSGTRTFDAIRTAEDPRSLQSLVERGWGESLVLHPGNLVLAATLEYIALPGDLSAQVMTRSSYGRMGLLTATAVMVHPWFMGCLTLELVNLGEVPVALVPGERVAQLVLHSVEPPAPRVQGKYHYPTGPEFSRIAQDPDVEVFARMREGRAE